MRLRSVALLLVVVACNGARQESSAPELYRRARAAIEHGDFIAARRIARTPVLVSSGSDAGYRDLLSITDAEALAREKPEEALALLDRSRPSLNPEARVRRLMVHGYAQQVLGHYDQAAALYAEADRLAAVLMPSLRGEITVLSAAPPFYLGKCEEAKSIAHRAIALGKAAHRPYVMANAYGMLGSVEMRCQEWEISREHLLKGERLARPIEAASTVTTITGNLGWYSKQLGDLDDAQVRFLEAERYAESQNVQRVKPTWLAHLASIYVARQQYTEALSYAERSLVEARKLQDQQKLATSLINLAQVHIELGHHDVAKKLNDEALALQRKQSDGTKELTALINDARIDDVTGVTDRALATLQTVIERAGDQPPVRWQAQAIAAEINRRLGRTAAAEQMYEAALETGDSARPALKSDDTYLFTFEANLIRFYDRYIDLLLAGGHPIDALRVAERSRARALREGLGLPADPHLDPVALARANNATILWYWLAKKRSRVWVISREGVAVATLQPQAEIEKVIDDYRRESLARFDGITSPRGTALFETLVRPALAHARGERFIVIPDGRLNDINLEAAVVSSPRPHYWIEDATISYAPSLQFLASTAAPRTLRGAHLLVVGNVPAHEGFPLLARAETEMKSVARHFDPRQRMLLDGADATRAAYLRADLRNTSFIHFATHSTASVASPLESSVILAGDRMLTGHDIAGTKLNAELVTVSSCSSAGRRSYAGEGLVGLAWAFLRAGAKRVVASQWDVSDSATSMLMDTMYGELASGHDPAVALRTAKLELLHSKNAYERPFYWAPFILYGAP